MLFLRIMARLPLRVLYLFAGITAFVAFYIIRYRYGVVIKNIERSFPQKSKDEVRKIAREFYHNLADWLVETLKASRLAAEELQKRVQFLNTGPLDIHLQQGKSAIVITTHQFNWEWLLLAGSLKFGVPIDAVYAPVSNRKIESLILSIRSRFGGQPIPKDNTLPIVLQRIKEQRIIGMVADQIPARNNQNKYWTTFLNQETAFFMGAEMLPKVTRLPVIFMGIRKVKRGFYQVRLEEIAQPPYNLNKIEILPAYIAKAEQAIRAAPESWLWSHRRWKYPRGAYE